MKNKRDLYKKIVASESLPALPEVLVKLLEITEDEQRPLGEVSELINKDSVLSFKVLHLVNSAYYSLRRKLTSIEQAVVYLGTKSIKNITITTAIHQVFEQKRFGGCARFDIKHFWWHSLLSATLAKRIAQKVGYNNADEAYLAGLLHDIGRLVLLAAFPEEQDFILGDPKRPEDTLRAEQEHIGITHCEAGARLVREWRLDSLLADAVEYHHMPVEDIAESFILIKIIYLANVLSHEYADVDKAAQQGELLLNLGAAELQDLVSGAIDEMYDIAEQLGISIDEPRQEQDDTSQKTQNSQGDRGADHESRLSSLHNNQETQQKESPAQIELQRKVRDVALLTGILDTLSKVESVNEMIGVFEEAVHVLFGLERVLFLLPDSKDILLQGRVSETNPYREMSEGLTIPIRGSSSQIFAAYQSGRMRYITQTDENITPADRQTISVMKCPKIALVPLHIDAEPVGIILIGIPFLYTSEATEEHRLLQSLAHQIGAFLHIERMKAKKAAELEAERMAAISLAAKKFAHEVNNPLGIIMNYLGSLQIKLPENTDVQHVIDIINQEIERISTMVNQLDLFSQPAGQDVRPIHLNEVLEDIVQLVKDSFFNDGGVRIYFEPCRSLPPLKTSRNGIKQIVINLLKNSFEAMAEGGKINIVTRLKEKNLQNGMQDSVQILISDDGPGLPPSVKENLFKPFVTTKEGNHSGLGLSIVYKTVHNLGGEIQLSRETSPGTLFTLTFPLGRS